MTAVARLFLLLLVVGAGAVACGSDDGEETGGAPPGSSSPSGRVLTVEEALSADGESVAVGGALFVEGDLMRLCDAVMESFPPQCGGATIRVVGLDPTSVTLQSSDDGRVQWAEGMTLEGVVDGDQLRVG